MWYHKPCCLTGNLGSVACWTCIRQEQTTTVNYIGHQVVCKSVSWDSILPGEAASTITGKQMVRFAFRPLYPWERSISVQVYMSPSGPQNNSECSKNKTTTPIRNQTLVQDVSLHEVTTSLLITLQSHCQARFLNVISYPHVTPHVPWDGCYCYWFILTSRHCGAVVATCRDGSLGRCIQLSPQLHTLLAYTRPLVNLGYARTYQN
jgi:hypothetical protein